MPIRDDHQELLIVKGVAAAKGDTSSAEIGLISINLLAEEDAPGWSLNAEGGWSPKRAQLKGGGTWADSAISAGRSLVAGVDGNVIETLQLTVTGTNILDLAAQLARMGRMRQAVIDFGISPGTADPVYLHWYAREGAGAQYALIHALDIAEDEPDVWQTSIRDVTITIEREPYWRGLPPGANPKVWTLGLTGTVDNLSLWENTDHLHYEQIRNKQELNTDYVTPITKNYIDIPASKIPGDAPALVLLDWVRRDVTNAEDHTVFIARSTKPITRSSHPTVKTHKTLISLNGGDESGAGTGVTKVLDATRGVISNGSTTNAYYVNTTFSANPQTRTVIWGSGASLLNLLDQNTLRGQYAFFLRHKQNGGAVGDIKVQLELRINSGATAAGVLYQSVLLQAIPTTVLDASISAGFYAPLYLGTATIPFGDHLISSLEGWGVDVVKSGQFSLEVRLNITRSTGVGTLYFVDLIMLPFDEALVEIHPPNEASGRTVPAGDYWHMVYDNTGHMAHGDNQPRAFTFRTASGAADTGFEIELRGDELCLMPAVDNRLFFFSQRFNVSSGVIISSLADEPIIRLNIVPRWIGIRSQ